EDRRLREGLDAGAVRQYSSEGGGVIAERRQARRVMTVDCTKVLLEDPARFGCRGGEPAADERRLIADIGRVPEPAAEQLPRVRLPPRLPDLPGELFERGTPFREQQGVEGR